MSEKMQLFGTKVHPALHFITPKQFCIQRIDRSSSQFEGAFATEHA
jgi:hypothetical protein